MKALRSMIESFTSSTQNVGKLIKFQNSTECEQYAGKRAVKLLQDVITRWWSTYRSCRRALHLKTAIVTLVTTGQLEVVIPTDDQWTIIEQIAITLEPMAKWQKTLEGEDYVTGSLVVLAIFRIRKQFTDVIHAPATKEPVKELTKRLLTDFDGRYQPANDDGAVQYTGKTDIGRGNRYIGVHPYLFFASMCDPRTKRQLKRIMDQDQYDQMKQDFLQLMIEKMTVLEKSKSGAKSPLKGKDKKESSARPIAAAEDEVNGFDDDYDGMWGDMLCSSDDEEGEVLPFREDKVKIRKACEVEFEKYMADKGLPIQDSATGKFTDPLSWWKTKDEGGDFPIIARLAELFLSIPATSAPSERIWSRTALIKTNKRSQLSEEIVNAIMYVKENAALLHKHYEALTKNDANPPELGWYNFPHKAYNEIDVGQGDF